MRLVATCGPGQYLGSDYQCVSCPAGAYQTGEGMQNRNNCTLCAQGTYSHSSGATAADDCSESAGDVRDIDTSKSEEARFVCVDNQVQ